MTPALVALIHVTDVTRITPRMVRVTFTGDGLDTLTAWPDQQLKLCFPRPGQNAPRLPDAGAEGDAMRWYRAFLAIPEDERPWMRSYTVRSHDPARREISIDFVLHDGDSGPATRWAASAAVGDTLGRYGPDAVYAGQLPLDTADWLLFAGDATALPAISSLIEALPDGARALACVEVADAAEEQPLAVDRPGVTVRWVHRQDAPGGPGEALLPAVRDADIPSGETFAWLAGEAGAVRTLRRHLVGERGIAKSRIHFTGYWRRSLTQDDAPTEEDLAEAQERISALRAESGAGQGS
ncbi:siderophore-interacting protein [Streptomyces sp. NPDC048644]|uniref:siderophore-interacting protein n=1 Tax=Streptomyces sp. NPDC048644 TaxID=3365582 RepID=UPI00370F791E